MPMKSAEFFVYLTYIYRVSIVYLSYIYRVSIVFITSQTAVIGLQRHFIIGEQEDIRMISAGYEFGEWRFFRQAGGRMGGAGGVRAREGEREGGRESVRMI